MKYLASFFVLLTVIFFAPAARADSIFDLSGVFQSGATMTGVMTYNGSAISSADVYITEGTHVFEFIYGIQGSLPLISEYGLAGDALLWTGLGQLNLYLPISSLMDFTGSTLCSTSSSCVLNSGFTFLDGSGLHYDPLESGSLAVTPEPSSILLMGTGLLAVAFFMRRRFLEPGL